MEVPFLTGELAYNEPYTTVTGGMLAKISSLYPYEPIDITEALQLLPDDGTVPALPKWKWVHVPGHTPGKIALFRERDRLLISADAVITVQQDSLYLVFIQKDEVCGTPVYFTADWPADGSGFLHYSQPIQKNHKFCGRFFYGGMLWLIL